MRFQPWADFVTSILFHLINGVPNLILSMFYSEEKLKKEVVIIASEAGPQIYVTPGRPLSIRPIQLTVFNRLPFPIDLDGMTFDIIMGDIQLATSSHNIRKTICKADMAQLSLTCNLNDNQAKIVREFPSRAQPADCLLLGMRGTAYFVVLHNSMSPFLRL